MKLFLFSVMFSHSKMKTEFNKNHNSYEVTMAPPPVPTLEPSGKITNYFL